ncbi:MAG: ADP-ribosylglycohydrolase family protein [Planctomycetales bacterium]|nr:ADP-ribosylglycohydrolase family protein [Planctomycetales bacterium]
MIGAIAGDIIGSVYEIAGNKSKRFELFADNNNFTDDTVLTVAVAEWLMTGADLVDVFHEYFRLFPAVGYGGKYRQWAMSGNRDPYNSFGNGSAMRVSPVAWAFDTLEEVLEWARRSAEVTHNHPEGIKGAQAVAGALFIARTGGSKEDIIEFCMDDPIGYRVDRSVHLIRREHTMDVTCQGSVPEAISCVLEAKDYEDAIRNAVSLGGDADTQACIAGGIAEALWGVPEPIREKALGYLDGQLHAVVTAFTRQHIVGKPCRCAGEPAKIQQ